MFENSCLSFLHSNTLHFNTTVHFQGLLLFADKQFLARAHPTSLNLPFFPLCVIVCQLTDICMFVFVARPCLALTGEVPLNCLPRPAIQNTVPCHSCTNRPPPYQLICTPLFVLARGRIVWPYCGHTVNGDCLLSKGFLCLSKGSLSAACVQLSIAAWSSFSLDRYFTLCRTSSLSPVTS